MRHRQLVRSSLVAASEAQRSLTPPWGSDLFTAMFRKKAPRLAAAFVVTISAGCGGSTSTPPDRPPTDDGFKPSFYKDSDGKCFIQHPANPPWNEPVDCETQKPLKEGEDKPTTSAEPKFADPPVASAKPDEPKPPETPPKVDESTLPEMPAGWHARRNPDGSCQAFAPSMSCPKGALCNPPRPRTVKCPPNLPKASTDI